MRAARGGPQAATATRRRGARRSVAWRGDRHRTRERKRERQRPPTKTLVFAVRAYALWFQETPGVGVVGSGLGAVERESLSLEREVGRAEERLVQRGAARGFQDVLVEVLGELRGRHNALARQVRDRAARVEALPACVGARARRAKEVAERDADETPCVELRKSADARRACRLDTQ